MIDPVATTALLVAAIRAEESLREEGRLFHDPFAAALAGDDGRRALAAYRAAAGAAPPIIEVRTRFFDEALARAGGAGVRQFVIVAAGMDARSYRELWPPRTRIFEVDQPGVMAAKRERLGGAVPACKWAAVGADLEGDWPAALKAEGFDPGERTGWLVEGLLQYFDAPAVDALFARIDALSAPRSTLLYDVVGRSLLESPALAPTLRMMSELGAPWRFGTDEPAALAARHGWAAEATEIAAFGARLGRWPFPPAPPGVPGVPRGYLVEATKG